MGFLSKSENTKSNGKTTKGFYLGSPEAEAENVSKKQNLAAFFEDYMEIENQIRKGKFIISGRKGSGKSAFVKYLLDNSGEENEMYCSLISNNEFDLEKIIQNIPNSLTEKYEIIYEWIILTRLVQLILKSKNVTYTQEYKALELFYKKNSGIIEIDKYLISEISQNKEIEVNLNPLKGVFNTVMSKAFANKQVKAPFYCFIPTLREIVINILRFEALSNIDFILLFDDLDVKFKMSNANDKIKLLDLIRITKKYNNEYFKSTNRKILVFLRDDIGKRLDGIDSDKNKIFGSYEYRLNWFNHESVQMQEKDILLRKFINRRLRINFETLNLPYDREDPWKTLVDNSIKTEYNGKTAFRYILNFTFYRPRDLVNIFKDIGTANYEIPLNPSSIKSLLKNFVITNVGEIKDELTVLFDSQEIEKIFELLKLVSKRSNLSYTELLELMNKSNVNESLFSTLVDYCLLIPKDISGYCFYNYREQPLSDRYENYEYSLPKSLYIYFTPNAI